MKKNKTIENINKLWFSGGHLSEVQRDYFVELFSQNDFKNCLEIGFAGGRHTSTLLNCCTPETFFSVDINFDYHNGREYIQKIKESFPITQFKEGDSTKILSTSFFQENFPQGLDYILVDGGHTYDIALKDMENCFPNLSDNGIMIVDDYKSGPPKGCPIPDVTRAVEDFAKKHNLTYETIKLSDGKGMALFKKTAS